MHDLLQGALVASLLAAAVRLTTPIVLAAMGELVAERAGIMNLGIEGTVLAGCFVAFMVKFATGSTALAIAAAVFAGLGLGLVTSFAVVTLRLEQFVVGLSLNLLCSALTGYLYRLFLQSVPAESALIEPMTTVRVPLLSDLPVVGPALFDQTPLTYAAYLAAPVIGFWLMRTHAGLQLRCLGENPKLIAMAGASVAMKRYGAISFGAGMAGLAGAALSAGSSMRFVEEMSGGRGWLALVAVVAANWRPARVPLLAFGFALLQAIQITAQAMGSSFPYEVLLALPYVVAIVLLVCLRAASRMPAALGVPYSHE